ncbi:PA domain-containing protein [Sphingomonas laterariae]|uniref:Carboxypeptidase Q n=1 Tax=Edaphosphingomonas laterariae TaxID=861865 RepID=A0A239BHN2_9SPHN|nr:M28 family peptidase [Sphingomonas laterariae]SNS06624.1 PA domain-containing protein [Sphingomonas laterariae]
MRLTAVACATAAIMTAPALAQTLDVAALRDAALKDEIAWNITEGLTTEVGQRLAGTEAEARARIWGLARLKALGFSNARIEPFDMPVWVRGEETAEIVSPFPQKLVLAALGNSGATPPEGITAEVVAFPSLAALEAATDAQVRGKIVFVDHAMGTTQDGSSYGAFGAARRKGPSIASQKGAAAIVIRSIGTDFHRNPHTGVQSWADGITPIPAAALSLPDAEQLKRIVARGKPVSMKLVLTPRNIGTRQSGNLMAEVPGRDPKAGIVLVGCHLDSWDLGTGAIDDATGCGIVAAAAKRVMDAGKPLRTIRVVWFGAEEVGILGGKAYRDAHRDEKHAILAESDFGADRVYRFDSYVNQAALPVVDRLAAALAPIGVARGNNAARGGSDIGPLAATGVPVIALRQDGTRYFDLHHTPDDTLDKVDRTQLAQNVAAWTAMIATVANEPAELGPVAPTGDE